MSSVMLAGSRHLDVIPAPAVQRLEELISTGTWFLVGDASGVDAAFQSALDARGYSRVVVFTSLESPRNNKGNWQTRTIASSLKSASAAKHTVKDRGMVEKADFGIMIWDCQSVGTLANVIDFVDRGKSCFVWTPGDEFLWEMDSPQSLGKFTGEYADTALAAKKRLTTFHRRQLRQGQLVQEPLPGAIPF